MSYNALTVDELIRQASSCLTLTDLESALLEKLTQVSDSFAEWSDENAAAVDDSRKYHPSVGALNAQVASTQRALIKADQTLAEVRNGLPEGRRLITAGTVWKHQGSGAYLTVLMHAGTPEWLAGISRPAVVCRKESDGVVCIDTDHWYDTMTFVRDATYDNRGQ